MEIVPILDSDYVFRRLPRNNPSFIKPDGSITSAAFKTRRGEDGLSVDLDRLTTIQQSVMDVTKYQLCKLSVAFIRQVPTAALDVVHNPQPDNDAHCLIVPEVSEKSAKTIKVNAEIVV